MTIQNTTIRKVGPSQGNGFNTAFPFTFKVFTATDILVTYLDALGADSVLVLSTNYTVSLNADQNTSPGGSVTLLVAPATATYITLTSQVTNTQSLSLTNSGGFYPSSINDALDRIVIQVQQLAEQVTRAAKAPLSGIGALTPSSLVFGVDATGTPILLQLANISLSVVSTFMSGLLGLTSAAAVKTALSVQSDLQTQANTAVLTTGTATAYVATPSPAIATPIANTRLRLKLHLASGATPTLTIGTVTAALQQYDATGALVTATLGLSQLTDVEYNGAVYVVLDPLTPVILTPVIKQIQPITASVAAGSMTCTLNPTSLDFRSATLTSWAVNNRVVAAAISIVVPSTATLGTVSAQQSRLVLLALDNAGTPVLGVTSMVGGENLDETTLMTTNAIGTSCTFTGAIAVTTGILTLSAIGTGTFALGQSLAGTGVPSGTYVKALLTGTLGAAASTYSTNITTAVASTTLTGSAGAGVYTTTAVTASPFRVVGYIESTQATAGTWATAPSTIQGQGGQALTAMSSLGYGQTWQVFTYASSGAQRNLGQTYTNSAGKPIMVSYSTNQYVTVIVSGITIMYGSGYNSAAPVYCFIVPAGATYSISATYVAGYVWAELR